jgi:UDP:flavonoid glycosyltransferase YjiC (YdhE family)
LATLALFCLSQSLAHAGRVVRLARALAARGHHTQTFGDPRWLHHPALCPPGALPPPLPLAEPPLDDVLRPSRGLPPAFDEAQMFVKALDDDLAALDRLKPALVIVDNRRSTPVAAAARGLPCLSLTTTPLLGPYAGPLMTAEQARRLGEGLFMTPPRGEGVLSGRAAPLPGVMAWAMMRHGAPPRGWLHELSLGDTTLVLDPPGLFTPAAAPPGARWIGPIFPEIRPETPPPRLGPGPWVYLSYGSTGSGERLGRVAAALLDAGLQVLVSTGGLTTLAPRPGLVCLPLVAPEWAFDAASLVICHGGTLTVYHALSRGKPVLAVPSHVEQLVSAAAVERLGVGAALSERAVDADPGLLVSTARALLADPNVSARAAAVAARLDGASALAQAVAAAEALLT